MQRRVPDLELGEQITRFTKERELRIELNYLGSCNRADAASADPRQRRRDYPAASSRAR
jgi:hypothetical protein